MVVHQMSFSCITADMFYNLLRIPMFNFPFMPSCRRWIGAYSGNLSKLATLVLRGPMSGTVPTEM
jgi:hypothetical protein